MKNEKGMTYLTLLIILVIMVAVVVTITFSIRREYEEKQLEDARTDLLLIQGKIKLIAEKITAKQEEATYVGKKVADNREETVVKELLEKGIIAETEEGFDSYYLLEKQDLENLGLTKLSLKEDTSVIANYATGEIILSKPIEAKEKVYYKLSELKQEKEENQAVQENIEEQIESQEKSEEPTNGE